MSRARFLTVSLLFVCLTARAALVPGPERQVGPLAYGPAYGTQYPQTLASNGSEVLSVWIDQTPGRDGLYAAVLTESGATRPMPPRPIVRGHVIYVQAVWVGDAYLLLWFDGRVPGVLSARLSRDGELISQPVVVAAGYGPPVSVAWNGSRALVLLARNEGPNALLLNASGHVLRDDIFIGTHDGTGEMAVAAAGDDFLAVTVTTRYVVITTDPWDSRPRSTVRMSRISSEGEREASAVLVPEMPNHAMGLSIASHGNLAGIAFTARGEAVGDPAKVMRFTIDVPTLQPEIHPPVLARGDVVQVVSGPAGFIAGTLEYAGATLYLSSLAFTSSQWNRTPVGPSYGADLRMGATSGAVTAVWRDYRYSPQNQNANMQMFGIALDRTAVHAQRDVAPVAISAVAQAEPVIAPAGNEALVVWLELPTTGRASVMARRIDRDGKPLDAQPLVLATNASSWAVPRAVFTGEVWMVAWLVDESLPYHSHMRRVGRDGAILDTAPVPVGGVGPLASNGQLTVMATNTTAGVGVIRFSRSGEQLDAQPFIVTDRAGYSPVVGTNGTDFLLAWIEGSDWWQLPSPNYRDVHAMRLDSTGTPIAAVIDIANGPEDEATPRIASDGTDFLVVYAQDGLRAKRVLRTGVLADTTATADGNQIAADGHFPFAVTSHRDGYVVTFTKSNFADSKMHAVELDARGMPVAPARELAASEAPAVGAAVGTLNGSVVVAYTRTAPEPEYVNIRRVFVRKVAADEVGRRRSVRR